jgi:predicted DNA-binding protein (UPF0251 family)
MENELTPEKSKIEENCRLSGQQLEAAKLLLTPMKQNEIAEQVGIVPDTLSRWLKQDDFKAYLSDLRDRAKERAIQMLAEGVTDAAYMLHVIANKGDRRACVDVLKAARVYVDRVEADHSGVVNVRFGGEEQLEDEDKEPDNKD